MNTIEKSLGVVVILAAAMATGHYFGDRAADLVNALS